MAQDNERATLMAEMDRRRSAYFAAFRAAKEPAAQSEVEKTWTAFVADWGRRALESLRRSPDTGGGFALARALWTDVPERRADARRILLERYAADPAIGPFCQNLALDHEPEGELLLRRIREKNPSREARALAVLALAERILQGFDVYSQHPIPKAKRPAAVRDGERWLREVIAKYAGAAKVYGEIPVETRARRRLEGMRNVLRLEIGRVAPDIAGEDLFGRRFRLADYRGTVVMLDFWGNW